MTKAEMISAVAEKTGVCKCEVEKVVGAFFALTMKELKKGEKVRIPDFGGFEVRQRAARMGKNPKTGAPIKIAASKVIAFKAAKAAKEAL